MKALKNKYGKRRWIDTPLSAPCRKRMAVKRAIGNIMAHSIGYQAAAQVSAIRSSEGPREEKAFAIASVIMSAHAAKLRASLYFYR